MRKILRFFLLIADPPPQPSFNDMPTQVNQAFEYIAISHSDAMLQLIDKRAKEIANHYGHHPQTAFHVDLLHRAILLRRCEIIATRYPEKEES